MILKGEGLKLSYNSGKNFGLDEVVTYLECKYGWNPVYINNIRNEYEKFLNILSISKEPEKMSPSEIIDIFWHQHILDTKNYYDYCNNYILRYI